MTAQRRRELRRTPPRAPALPGPAAAVLPRFSFGSLGGCSAAARGARRFLDADAADGAAAAGASTAASASSSEEDEADAWVDLNRRSRPARDAIVAAAVTADDMTVDPAAGCGDRKLVADIRPS